jgi:hypothetical protein
MAWFCSLHVTAAREVSGLKIPSHILIKVKRFVLKKWVETEGNAGIPTNY